MLPKPPSKLFWSKLFSVVVLVSVSASSPCLAEGRRADVDRPGAGEGAALIEAVWRLDQDFTDWAEGLETARRKGVPYARGHRSAEDFLEYLDGLSTVLPHDPDSRIQVLRKMGVVRDRIRAWQKTRRVGRGAGSRKTEPGFLPGPVGPSCRAATAVGYGDFAWSAPPEDLGGASFWFRFEAPRSGWHRVGTTGSEADTRLAVLKSCSREPLAEEDDDGALQASLVFEAAAGEVRWIRVDLATGRPGGSLEVSIAGSGNGIMTGFVTEEGSGDPVASARVEFYRSNGSYAGSDWTDATGLYVETGLSEDSYYVLTDDTFDHLDELWDDHPCEPSCVPLTGDAVPVSDSVPGTADFELSRGGGLSGYLFSTDATPIVSGRVRLVDSMGSTVDDAYSDATGAFRFGGLLTGIYFAFTAVSSHRNEVWDDIPCEPTCIPTNGHVIAVTEGLDTTGIDFTLDRLGSVQGTLTDAVTGLPIPSGRVDVFRADGSYVTGGFAQQSGTWTAGGLQAGTYFVASDLYSLYRNEVYDDVPCQSECAPLTGTPIQVALDATTSGIDQALDRLGSISGTITESGSGFPLSSITVEVWSGSGAYEGGSSSTQVGHWEHASLQPGTYHVVTDERGIYIDELYDDIACPGGPTVGCTPQAGTPIDVALSEHVPGIDLVLDLGGAVSGRLVDERTEEPIVNEDVVLTATAPPTGLATTTDAAGQYLFTGLLSGEYFTFTATDTHADEVWDDLPCGPGGCEPLNGTPIPVDLGVVSSGIDFDLVLLGGLAGVVRDESGAPLPGVIIQVWNSAGGLVAGGVTNPDGLYQVDLFSGVYYLSTLNSHGLPDELWNGIYCPGGAGVGCDPLDGESILVIGADPVLTGFDFELGPTIFADGFESGDVSAWSNAVP